MATSKSNKGRGRRKRNSGEVPLAEKQPFIERKVEEARAFIKEHGIPEEFKD